MCRNLVAFSHSATPENFKSPFKRKKKYLHAMELNLTRHVRITISLLYKQKSKETNKQTKNKQTNKTKQTNKKKNTTINNNNEILIFTTFKAKF